MDDDKVKIKITPGHLQTNQQSNEQLFDRFYKKALATVPDIQSMQEALLAVHAAQVKSKQQLDPSVALENIEAITLEKGGTSLLFYRTAFSPAPIVQETELCSKFFKKDGSVSCRSFLLTFLEYSSKMNSFFKSF